MVSRRLLAILAILAAGGVAGAAAVVLSVEINRFTSTEEFCTSCHVTAALAADPHYQRSIHRSNAAGVSANCADCHIRKSNWFVETYTHASQGVQDLLAAGLHDYSDPAVWEKRRVELAHYVRNEMRAQDSATCRSCHDARTINPPSERGQAAHALLREGRMTCIDCHFNLVHAPVPATLEFIRGSGLANPRKQGGRE
jgi:nitrate/TMAO reductase-like tetraheme cytochrome c subunit